MVKKALLAVLVPAALAACTGNTGITGGEATGNGKEITVTGCVQAGVPPGTYVLYSERSQAGEVGTAGREGGQESVAGAEAEPYRLIPGGRENDLGQYLNRQVRVTGEIANAYTGRMPLDRTPGSEQGESSRGEGGQSQGRNPAAQSTSGQFIRVVSVETLAGSCK